MELWRSRLLGYVFRLVHWPRRFTVVSCCVALRAVTNFWPFFLFAVINNKFAFFFAERRTSSSTVPGSGLNRLKRPLGCELANGLIKCRVMELIQLIASINLTFHCCRTRWNCRFIIFLLAVRSSLCRPSHPIAMLNTLLSASWNPLSMPF